jgi:PncC family amidohydrolase
MIEYGVVSTQVVEEMCLGVRKKFNSNYSISVSGIAGPGGGTENKPVGMICFSIFEENTKIISDTIYLKGSRKSIQLGASKIILKKIYKFLQKRLDI